jgi:hypothetical protein
VLVDVDTWRGSDEQEHNAMDFDDVFDVYLKRIADYKNVSPLRMTSDEFFANKTMLFDFIYIDGDHTAFSVMKDLINAHSRINTNGIIACDDYHWSEGKGLFYEPRPAIDAFFNMTRDFYEVIEVGPQVWFRDARSV